MYFLIYYDVIYYGSKFYNVPINIDLFVFKSTVIIPF